ncbi:MAG: hypothetical protein ACREF7_02285, partial [Candidatus Saccharimonadales bacterium]
MNNKDEKLTDSNNDQPASAEPEKTPIDTSQFSELTLDDVAKVLSLTITDDEVNKKIVFLVMLSAYTDKSQLNVSLNAPSSTGKTYLATEIAELFPDEDKVERSGASPTSFFYGAGVFDKERQAKIVSLSRKILLFYDQPDFSLLEKLRSLMSHDKKEITHALTNKKGGRNQTDMIIVEGFPAFIFCSASLRLDEQEATRSILISPEATAAKMRRSLEMLLERWSNVEKFKASLDARPARIALKERIVAIREEHVGEVLISDDDKAAIKDRFLSMIHVLKPRNQRDLMHLLQTIKVIALLNVWYRRQPDGSVVASQSDISQAFELWDEFFEAQNLGISPSVLSIYKKYIVPAYMAKFDKANTKDKEAITNCEVGVTPQEVSTYHFQEEETMLNNDQLRKQILPQLEG